MSKKNLIFKIIIVFVLAVAVCFFTLKFLYNKILENDTKNSLEEIINLISFYENGEYILKNNILYDKNGNKIKTKMMNGTSQLIKTDYGINAKFQHNKICTYKTIGNPKILVYKRLCKNLNIKQEELEYNQNNAQITLKGNFSYYAVTKTDKIPESWAGYDKKELIITLPFHGEFYLWTKTSYGILSDPIKVKVDCLLKDADEISKSIIYCTGSKINLGGYSWHVISDKNGELKLLLDSSQLDLMSHCEKGIDDKYCYFKDNVLFKSYKWSISKINKYLNEYFLEKVSDYNLKEYEICDQTSGVKGCKGGDGCAGYLKEQMESGNYKCKKYASSKVRLLTFDEYNFIIKNTEDYKWLYGSKIGEFWLMNGYYENGFSAFKINVFGQCYLDENTSSLLEVRPVITIYK